MTTLNAPITPEQVLQLVRRMSADDRRKLMALLTAERFTQVLAESDRSRQGQPPLTDEDIQAEIDAARAERRQGEHRAAGH